MLTGHVMEATLLSGGARVAAGIERRILMGDGPMLAEVYQAELPSVVQAYRRAAQAGIPVGVLANPKAFRNAADASSLDAIRSGGAWVNAYGGADAISDATANWQHAKTYWFGGSKPEAWITNFALNPEATERSELAAVVEGPAARAVYDLTFAALGNDEQSMRVAARTAAAAGILVNDPVAGVFNLTDQMERLIDTSKHQLVVVTKSLDDADMTQRLVRARERGVEVQLVVRDLAPQDADLLEHGGVNVLISADAHPKPRVNAILSDNEAYLGSAFLWTPMTGRLSRNGSRDIGLLLGGGAADDTRRAVSMIAGGANGTHTLSDARLRGLLAKTT